MAKRVRDRGGAGQRIQRRDRQGLRGEGGEGQKGRRAGKRGTKGKGEREVGRDRKNGEGGGGINHTEWLCHYRSFVCFSPK